jgi:hypothetical protein
MSSQKRTLFDRIMSDFVNTKCFSYNYSVYTYKVNKNDKPIFKYKVLRVLRMFVADYVRILFKQKDAEETEKLGYRLKKGQIKYI